ncbi:hypothetical protein CLU79DRAFT_738765 [Phycomyces nitens]|nr:hypothetical protein CLU79DRAFT_738765 [Phycomyces nitens]
MAFPIKHIDSLDNDREKSRGYRRSKSPPSPPRSSRYRSVSRDEPKRRYRRQDEARSPSKDNVPEKEVEPVVNEDDDEETKMMKLMGFGGFETTKNKHVAGTDVSAANIRKPIKYRQYMNRRGGFNRPLDNA